MTHKEIEKSIRALRRNVSDGKLAFSLATLKALIRQSTRSDYFYEIESIEDNYRNLLKYAFEGYADPQRNEILYSIAVSILHLADELADHLLEDSFPAQRLTQASLNQEFGTDPAIIASKIDEIFFSHEVSELIEGETTHSSPVTDSIFKLIWLTREMKDYHIRLIRHINQESGAEWYEQCLVVSSLTLSLLSFFHPQKLELLSEFILKRHSQIYHRALTGFVLALIRYNDRIRFYPELVKLIDDLASDEDISKDVEAIILQLLMAGETERITKEFEEEVLPDMQKMMPKLGDKLQLDNVVEEDPEGENPVWKEMIDEVPGLFEKIEKFSRMQMEGADVFMSTFSMLKRFDFFNEMSHWFIPFYHDHPALQEGGGEDVEIRTRLMEGLEKAFYICNSDKYSFGLNFKAIPAQQRSMIVTHFEAELEQMKEMASEEEILDPAMISNATFTQYIQDLYRFYKLYPQKGEFDDIFKWKLSYINMHFLQKFSDQLTFPEQLAAFYFSRDHWKEAIDLYTYQEKMGNTSSQLYQKLGYAWQKSRNWEEARDAYKKAELFDTDRLWVLKKLVWCSIRVEDYTGALSYLRELLKLQPEDMNLLSQAGQCHLNMKDYSEALHYYNQVWSASPGNMKALRPIAYCKFTLGKLEEAAEAYQEIMESAETNTPYDFMNAGHVALCLGEKEMALSYYKSALGMTGFSKELFVEAFKEDSPYLIQHGIREEEIPLIVDYLILG
ncbi:MAG: tetratricopeptide repeat protein [Bacteroidia bacterium]|nr:tetratricopeptide repeat protein [Bacteroidia bacterium]